MAKTSGNLRVGWAQADITPEEPTLIAGQFYSRVSEEVLDPITTTALALDTGDDHAVMVSCDLVAIPDEFRDAVRAQLNPPPPGLDLKKIVINATHTHTAPEVRMPNWASGTTAHGAGVELKANGADQFLPFATPRIADAIRRAWEGRSAGKLAFGLGQAVVGRNRRWVDVNGRSTMYGNTNTPLFSHIEGFEDHSLGVVALSAPDGQLTGLIVNLHCTSQETEHLFSLSADFWCETRAELRRRFGKDLFILAQCSAAGDQSPHLIYDKKAHERMLELAGRTSRQEIAERIADGVGRVLPLIAPTAEGKVLLRHHAETVPLPLNALTEGDVRTAREEAAKCHKRYKDEMAKIEANPELKKNRRWYADPSAAFRMMRWYEGVAERYEKQKANPTQPAELHVVRLGDLAIATNPFEYYLDFGILIKARSPATQTLLVQLAGAGTYVPSARSAAGGGYGSVPASNPVGPQGGRMLAERTIEVLAQLWPGA